MLCRDSLHFNYARPDHPLQLHSSRCGAPPITDQQIKVAWTNCCIRARKHFWLQTLQTFLIAPTLLLQSTMHHSNSWGGTFPPKWMIFWESLDFANFSLYWGSFDHKKMQKCPQKSAILFSSENRKDGQRTFEIFPKFICFWGYSLPLLHITTALHCMKYILNILTTVVLQ